MHRDELLFQTVHQSSELWLKLAWHEVEEATALVDGGEVGGAMRLLRRAGLCLQYVTTQLDMLEQMSPWEYQEIRRVLGHGSRLRLARLPRDPPRDAAARRGVPRGSSRPACRVVDVYVHGREHEELYQLAEALIEWDERVTMWRVRHYKVVARVIGDAVVGTQGTPVEVLGRLIHKVFFPELWQARNELTALSQTSPAREPARRGHRAPAGADPARHGQSARERDARRRAAARLPGAERRRVRAATRSVPERANLVARLPGGDGPTLALICHTDTVLADPAEWQRDPWSGELVDGEVWGRGALDMKGQVAAGAVAFASLAREGFRPAGDVIFAATADEEVGDGFGLEWLVAGAPRRGPLRLLAQRGRRRARRPRRAGRSTSSRPRRR